MVQNIFLQLALISYNFFFRQIWDASTSRQCCLVIYLLQVASWYILQLLRLQPHKKVWNLSMLHVVIGFIQFLSFDKIGYNSLKPLSLHFYCTRLPVLHDILSIFFSAKQINLDILIIHKDQTFSKLIIPQRNGILLIKRCQLTLSVIHIVCIQ